MSLIHQLTLTLTVLLLRIYYMQLSSTCNQTCVLSNLFFGTEYCNMPLSHMLSTFWHLLNRKLDSSCFSLELRQTVDTSDGKENPRVLFLAAFPIQCQSRIDKRKSLIPCHILFLFQNSIAMSFQFRFQKPKKVNKNLNTRSLMVYSNRFVKKRNIQVCHVVK